MFTQLKQNYCNIHLLHISWSQFQENLHRYLAVSVELYMCVWLISREESMCYWNEIIIRLPSCTVYYFSRSYTRIQCAQFHDIGSEGGEKWKRNWTFLELITCFHLWVIYDYPQGHHFLFYLLVTLAAEVPLPPLKSLMRLPQRKKHFTASSSA